jgi:secretion/DNA translocation related TadE-like protein
MTAPDDRGSASIWVLTGGALLILVALIAVLCGGATLARHRGETAADAWALPVADQIGISADPCASAPAIAAANGTTLHACRLNLAADGRSGQVEVTVSVEVHLAVLGADKVYAGARAERDRS